MSNYFTKTSEPSPWQIGGFLSPRRVYGRFHSGAAAGGEEARISMMHDTA
jgi:hypothetical protein